ncbi:MAG: hypothetical protein HYY16_16255 [Planctomycetes bacterium]|nr:hypothetical protein [Planctomycetota bacterium]
MKRALLTLSFAMLAAGAAFAGVTKEDLKKLLSAGVGDEVVLSFIKANGPVDPLSADDLVELKKIGAGDKLLQDILERKEEKPQPQVQPKSDPQQTPAPPPQSYPDLRPEPTERVIERETVVVERPSTTVYVYDEPSVVYYPSPDIVTTVYCRRHRVYDSCAGFSTYAYPSYGCTPRSWYSWRATPSYSFGTYRRSRRCGSFSIGVGW